MEESRQLIPENSKYDYLKSSMTLDEIMEELDLYVKDLNSAQFHATLDLQTGIRMGFIASMKVIEDIIDRLEECSEDPENDEFITKLYNVYEALELIKNKCDYI